MWASAVLCSPSVAVHIEWGLLSLHSARGRHMGCFEFCICKPTTVQTRGWGWACNLTWMCSKQPSVACSCLQLCNCRQHGVMHAQCLAVPCHTMLCCLKPCYAMLSHAMLEGRVCTLPRLAMTVGHAGLHLMFSAYVRSAICIACWLFLTAQLVVALCPVSVLLGWRRGKLPLLCRAHTPA